MLTLCHGGLCEIKVRENKVTGKKGNFFTGCEIKVTGRKGIQNKRYLIFDENCNSVKERYNTLVFISEKRNVICRCEIKVSFLYG